MSASVQPLVPLLTCVAGLLMVCSGVGKRRLVVRRAYRRCPACDSRITGPFCGRCGVAR